MRLDNDAEACCGNRRYKTNPREAANSLINGDLEKNPTPTPLTAVTGQGCEIITEHEHMAAKLQTSRAPGPCVSICYSLFF